MRNVFRALRVSFEYLMPDKAYSWGLEHAGRSSAL